MKKYKQYLGQTGEAIATKYLKNKGFEIIETNFYTKWGEVDIIAHKNNRLHFIEVKTRTTLKFGRPEESVTRSKYQKAKRAVVIYLNQHNLQKAVYQIDVLAILYNSQKNQANIRYFPNILLT